MTYMESLTFSTLSLAALAAIGCAVTISLSMWCANRGLVKASHFVQGYGLAATGIMMFVPVYVFCQVVNGKPVSTIVVLAIIVLANVVAPLAGLIGLAQVEPYL